MCVFIKVVLLFWFCFENFMEKKKKILWNTPFLALFIEYSQSKQWTA